MADQTVDSSNNSINYSKVFNFDYVFDFEKRFNYRHAHQWMQTHFKQSFYWVILYLAFIYFGRIHMERKSKPYRLRLPLIIWNTALALFSIFGTIRSLPYMVNVLKNQGFQQSVCSNSHFDETPIGFWAFMFVLSKLPELVDTVFVVLRKQKLIFLHWYHHATVLIYSWFLYADLGSTSRWYLSMNYFVHAIMYSYYALRAYGIRVPKMLAMWVTLSQIIQMIVGAFVTFYSFYVKTSGQPCKMSYTALYAALAIYISYLLLFVNFFIKSYFTNTNQSRKTATEESRSRPKAE